MKSLVISWMIIFLIGTLQYSSSVSHSKKGHAVSKSAKFVSHFLTSMGMNMKFNAITKKVDENCSYLKKQQLMAKVIRRINKIKLGMNKLKKLRINSSGKRRKFYRNLGKVHLAKMLRDLLEPVKNCSVVPKETSNHIKEFLKTIALILKGKCYQKQCNQFSFRVLNRVYRYFLASIAHSKVRRIKFQKGKSTKNKRVRSNQERSSNLIRRIAKKLASLLKTFIKIGTKTKNSSNKNKQSLNHKPKKPLLKNNFSGFSGLNHDYPNNNPNNHPDNIPNTNLGINPNNNPNANPYPNSNSSNFPSNNLDRNPSNGYPNSNQNYSNPNRINNSNVNLPNSQQIKKHNSYPKTKLNYRNPKRIPNINENVPKPQKSNKHNRYPDTNSNYSNQNRIPNSNKNVPIPKHFNNHNKYPDTNSNYSNPNRVPNINNNNENIPKPQQNNKQSRYPVPNDRSHNPDLPSNNKPARQIPELPK